MTYLGQLIFNDGVEAGIKQGVEKGIEKVSCKQYKKLKVPGYKKECALPVYADTGQSTLHRGSLI